MIVSSAMLSAFRSFHFCCRLALWLCLGCLLPAQGAEKNILVFGDSLSAGHGIALASAWPSLLAERLRVRFPDYNVVNLSISGETSAGGRARLPDALRRHRPAIVILELGANDGLRGLPLAQLEENLAAMIDAAQKSKARLILVGTRLPPNYGPYADHFSALFGKVAKAHALPAPPFLLEGFAEKQELFQSDGLHPTAAAQERILENIWPLLQPLLH
jgi:acyl-CoA thioesterase-1